jgi:hypothetical protein
MIEEDQQIGKLTKEEVSHMKNKSKQPPPEEFKHLEQKYAVARFKRPQTAKPTKTKESGKLKLTKERINQEITNLRPVILPKVSSVIDSELKSIVETVQRDLQKLLEIEEEEKLDHVEREKEVESKLRGRIKSGNGVAFLNNGDIYSGSWQRGLRDGTGSCKFYQGGYYKGVWVDDEINGKGVYMRPDGITLMGIFLAGGKIPLEGGRYKILY